jgi:hypothetical protein
LRNGNFVVNDSDTGDIFLYNSSGTQIASTNAWTDPDGWAYDYGIMGDIAGLLGGGCVVLPDFGAYYFGGAGYTPYLYFYNNNLNLINKVDITASNITLFAIVGLSSGGFAGLGNTDGGDYLSHLFYFDSQGNLESSRDITVDIPSITTSHFVNFSISSTNDGGVIVGSLFGSSVWVFHSPPVEVDLSGDGVTSVGGVGGSYFQSDYQCSTDCDGDEQIGIFDLAIIKTEFGQTGCDPQNQENCCRADFDNDTQVGLFDLSTIKTEFGRSNCPGSNPPCSF